MWKTRGFARGHETSKNSANVEKTGPDIERTLYSFKGKEKKSTESVDNFFMRRPDFSSKHSLEKTDDPGGAEGGLCSFG